MCAGVAWLLLMCIANFQMCTCVASIEASLSHVHQRQVQHAFVVGGGLTLLFCSMVLLCGMQ